MSVNKSEKRTPATMAIQIGLLLQHARAMPWASVKAAHCPADRRKKAMSKPAGTTPCSNRNQMSGANQAMKKRLVSSNSAALNVIKPAQTNLAPKSQRRHSNRVKPFALSPSLSDDHIQSGTVPDVCQRPAYVALIGDRQDGLDASHGGELKTQKGHN
jgi:hypothetical protein